MNVLYRECFYRHYISGARVELKREKCNCVCVSRNVNHYFESVGIEIGFSATFARQCCRMRRKQVSVILCVRFSKTSCRVQPREIKHAGSNCKYRCRIQKYKYKCRIQKQNAYNVSNVSDLFE